MYVSFVPTFAPNNHGLFITFEQWIIMSPFFLQTFINIQRTALLTQRGWEISQFQSIVIKTSWLSYANKPWTVESLYLDLINWLMKELIRKLCGWMICQIYKQNIALCQLKNYSLRITDHGHWSCQVIKTFLEQNFTITIAMHENFFAPLSTS